MPKVTPDQVLEQAIINAVLHKRYDTVAESINNAIYVLTGHSRPISAHWAAEMLGISKEEYDILTKEAYEKHPRSVDSYEEDLRSLTDRLIYIRANLPRWKAIS